MAVRIEKILCTVLNEAHDRQVEESMDDPNIRTSRTLWRSAVIVSFPKREPRTWLMQRQGSSATTKKIDEE